MRRACGTVEGSQYCNLEVVCLSHIINNREKIHVVGIWVLTSSLMLQITLLWYQDIFLFTSLASTLPTWLCGRVEVWRDPNLAETLALMPTDVDTIRKD